MSSHMVYFNRVNSVQCKTDMGNIQCKKRNKTKKTEGTVVQNHFGNINNYYTRCSCTKAEQPPRLYPLNKQEQTEERKRAQRKRKRLRCDSFSSEESEENEPIHTPWIMQQESCSDNSQVFKPKSPKCQRQCQKHLTTDTDERTYSVNNTYIPVMELVGSIDFEDETHIKGQTSVKSFESSPVSYRKKTYKSKEGNSDNHVGYDSPTNSTCNVFRKRLISESVFHTGSDDECTLKSLDLRCESDTEELSALKLPGPAFEQEITEVKSTAHVHMLVNIDQMPSGYPLESDTEYELTQGISCEFCETFSELSDNEDICMSQSWKTGESITNMKPMKDPTTSSSGCENQSKPQMFEGGEHLQKESEEKVVIDRQNVILENDYVESCTGLNYSYNACDVKAVMNVSDLGKEKYDNEEPDESNLAKENIKHEEFISSSGCEVQASHNVLVGNEVVLESKEIIASNKQNMASDGLDKKDKGHNASNIKDDLAERVFEKYASFQKYGDDTDDKSVVAENVKERHELDKVAKEKVKCEEINTFESVVTDDSEDKRLSDETDSCYFSASLGTSSNKGHGSNMKIDRDTNNNVKNVDENTVFLLNQGDRCKKNGISESKQLHSGFEHYDYIPIHSFFNPNLFAILIHEKDESKTSVLKISEKGLLQEVTLSQYEDKFVDEACLDESDRGSKESVNKRKGNTCLKSDLCYTRKPGNLSGFSKSDLDLTSVRKEFQLHSGRKYVLTAPHEYHGLEIYRTECYLRRRTFSENDLSNLMRKHHHNLREDNLISFEKDQDINYSDWENQEIAFAKFSKSIIPENSGPRQKRLKKKKTKTVKPELSSLTSQQSEFKSTSWTNKGSTKLRYKRKNKRSWTNSFSRHLKSKTPHNELTVSFIDSGFGGSQSLMKSDSVTYTIVHKSDQSKHHSSLTSRKSTKMLSILLLKKKKSVKRLLTRNVNKYFHKHRVPYTKSIVRCLIGRPWTDPEARVLDSYFQKYSNGQQPTLRERMQYEWIRFSSFHNYSGNGNTLALARNGFYHDHADGPTSTRCFLCGARNSNWERFDDVSAEHRRQSPNCPFHESNEQESVNISITYEDNVRSSSAPTTTSGITSASSIVTARSTSTSSSTTTAAINEAVRTLQISQAPQQVRIV